VPDEPTDPRLGAKRLNELIEYGQQRQRELLRLIFKNYMQDGYMPLTKPLTGQERQAWLQTEQAARQALEMLQDQDPAVRAQGLELAAEIQEARSGQPTAT